MLQPKKEKQASVAKVKSSSLWKNIVGGALSLLGALFIVFYLQDPNNLAVAFGAIVCLAGGGGLLYFSLSNEKTKGYTFNKKVTGKENSIVLLARKLPNGKECPIGLKFLDIPKRHIPPGTRMRFVRNLKKHFYYLKLDTSTHKLVPVSLPDKAPYPPELYNKNATMQEFKDAIEYKDPSLAQKLAPGAILLAMIIVGFLMIVTMDGKANNQVSASLPSQGIVQVYYDR